MAATLAGVTLHVADVDRSVAFYRQLPGATVLFHMPGRFGMLQFGTGRLGLLADQKRQFHVELEVPDLDAAAVALRELGIAADGPTTRDWGERDILVHDPDGYLLEFAVPRAAR
jgi:catechol 2,3-dioxygenase-like lactoylglutathione lyase family enzyme